MVSHYVNDSTSADYLRAAIEWETDGERSPVQTDPPAEVFDDRTPALLRRQVA